MKKELVRVAEKASSECCKWVAIRTGCGSGNGQSSGPYRALMGGQQQQKSLRSQGLNPHSDLQKWQKGWLVRGKDVTTRKLDEGDSPGRGWELRT